MRHDVPKHGACKKMLHTDAHPTGFSGCSDSRYSICATIELLIPSSMGPLTHTILSRSSLEYMSKPRSPRAVVSITYGMW